MNLSAFISTYSGQTIGSGQCGDLVDLYLVDVFDNHTSYATALDYWTNGIPGFSVVSSPEAGDIACYNAHPGFPDGHIAIYDGNGEVFEQNADPDGSPAHLFARANTYLLGYLRQGAPAPVGGQGIMNENGVTVVIQAAFRRAPTPEELSYWTGQPFDVCLANLEATSEYAEITGWMKAGEAGSTVNKETVLAYIEANLS